MGEQRAPAAILHFLRAGETQGRGQVTHPEKKQGQPTVLGLRADSRAQGWQQSPVGAQHFLLLSMLMGGGPTTLMPRKPS